MASRGRELIGEAVGPHLFGFKVTGYGDTKTTGEELISGLFTDQVRFAGQQGLIHFQQTISNHDPIDHDLIACANTNNITFDQFSRVDDSFLTLPDDRDLWAG